MEYMIDNLSDKAKRIDDNDYIKDGLVYCSKCGTPKQYKLQFKGNEKIVWCMCKCESEQFNKEQEQRKLKEEFEYIQRLRINGIKDNSFIKYRFEYAKENQNIKIAKRYCDKWDEVYKNNIGLLFWGNVGTGKTYVAGCIANYLLNKKVPVLMTNFINILNELQKFDDNNEYIISLNKYKLLIIDDLGAERQSDFALEQVFNIIDGRYKNGQPIIITTNLTIDEIKSPKEIKYKRIYDRVLELCQPIKFDGESKRVEKSSNKRELLKEILK